MWNFDNSFEFDQSRTQTQLADGLVTVQTKFTMWLDHWSSRHGTGGHSFWEIWIRGCWFEWSVQHGHLEINWWRCKEFVFVRIMVAMLKSDKFQANLFNSEGLGSSFIFSGGKSRVLKPYFYWVILSQSIVILIIENKKWNFFQQGRSFPSAPHDYCGSGIPNDFISSSKRVKVRFRSNESIQKPGFQLIARMTPGTPGLNQRFLIYAKDYCDFSLSS